MRTGWTLLLGAAAGLLAACGSGGAGQGGGTRADGGRVSIPAEVTAQLDAWIAREATLIGDVVEVEATSVPFAGAIAIEVSREVDAQGRRIVERTETTDPATNVRTITLVNRSGFQTAIDALPRARLGTGRQFLATDRLVLRYVPPPGMDRPVSITAVASGRARLVEQETTARTVRAPAIAIRADVVQGPRGYEFRSSEEKRP